MSADLKDSIWLWLGGIGFAMLFWAAIHFEIFPNTSNKCIIYGGGLLGLINFGMVGRGLWQRRASNSDTPDQRAPH